MKRVWLGIGLLAAVALLGTTLVTSRNKSAFLSASEAPLVELPPVDNDGPVSVEQSLSERRSVRSWADRALSRREVGQLLWAGQGVTRNGGAFRTAPSAGALYPMELFLVAGNVRGISPGVYHYENQRHALRPVRSGDVRPKLAAAAYGQDWMAKAPAILVLGGIYVRTTGKYGRRGRRYVHMEGGHIAQNVYLQATADDLGTVIVGAFDDDRVRDLLGLPGGIVPLALMPAGALPS